MAFPKLQVLWCGFMERRGRAHASACSVSHLGLLWNYSLTVLCFLRNSDTSSWEGGSGNHRPTAPVVCLQKLSWPSMELRGFGRLFMEEVCAWQCLCSTALYTPCLMRIFLAKSRWLCLGEAAQVNSFCHYQSIIACKTWWLSYSSKQMTSFSDRLIKGKGINWCGKSLLQKCDFPGIIP